MVQRGSVALHAMARPQYLIPFVLESSRATAQARTGGAGAHKPLKNSGYDAIGVQRCPAWMYLRM